MSVRCYRHAQLSQPYQRTKKKRQKGGHYFGWKPPSYSNPIESVIDGK